MSNSDHTQLSNFNFNQNQDNGQINENSQQKVDTESPVKMDEAFSPQRKNITDLVDYSPTKKSNARGSILNPKSSVTQFLTMQEDQEEIDKLPPWKKLLRKIIDHFL